MGLAQSIPPALLKITGWALPSNVNAFAWLATTNLDIEGTGDPFTKAGMTVRSTAKK